LGGYQAAIENLNATQPCNGFILREYSPESVGHVGLERRYFTTDNAAKIDAIRGKIAKWASDPGLTKVEERLLIADLLEATNQVANIAGTYGCFLREWSSHALEPIRLKARKLAMGDSFAEVRVGDAFTIATTPEDIVYIDPPYTKRQYAAYYHVLETIAHGDSPEVTGVTGLRPWRSNSSPFCYKRRVLRAFGDLIAALRSRRVLISYSSRAHARIDDLTAFLAQYGELTVRHLDSIGRYRPNAVATRAGREVDEYLFDLFVHRNALVAAERAE
jgi:adenine-specific DNA-methyltransferase